MLTDFSITNDKVITLILFLPVKMNMVSRVYRIQKSKQLVLWHVNTKA